jgi:tetratricopeptide (TPR) repeat protein
MHRIFIIVLGCYILITLTGRAGATDSHGFQTMLHQAHQAIAADKNPTEGRRIIETWLSKNPGHTTGKVFFLLGLARQMEHSWEKATVDYRQALDLDPHLTEARSNLAVCLYHLERFTEAGEIWLVLSESAAQKKNERLYQAALAFYRAGDFERARGAAHMLGEGPAMKMDWVLLTVKLNQETGQLDEAEQMLSRFLNEHPDHPERWIQLAALRNKLGRPAQAAAALEVAYSLAPPDARGWRLLADLYFAAAAPLEGSRCLKRIDEDDLDVDDMRRAAGLLLDAHLYHEALYWSERAIAFVPDAPGAWMTAGLAEMGLSRFKEAGDRFARALELDPDREQLRYLLGRSVFLDGRWPTARTWLQELGSSEQYADRAERMLRVIESIDRVETSGTASDKETENRTISNIDAEKRH